MENNNFNSEDDLLGTIIGFVISALVIVIYVWLIVMVEKKAAKYGRNSTLWTLASLFCLSPLVCLLLLYVLGETEEKKIENRSKIMKN